MSKPGTPREPRWSEAELTFLREHYGTMPIREIADELGRPYKGVTLKAHKERLRTRDSPKPWTEADTDYLVEHYENTPTMKIAAALGRRHATVKVQADKLGLLSIKRRARTSVNHDYFAEIDSPVKAYLLGLFASDGWLITDRNELGINLNCKDAQLVKLVRDELAPLYPVFISHGGKQVEFRVSSESLKADLSRHGVTPRKSLILQWPTALPEHLENSFILGCFDGDGSLWYNARQRYYHWSLVSASRPFLEMARTRIIAHTGIKIQGPYSQRKTRALVICYAGPRIRALDEWLHADVGGLDRKRPSKGVS